MPPPSDVLGSWPVQLGLTVAMAVALCWLFELALRSFTGTLRMPRRRARVPRRPRARVAVRAPRRPVPPVRRPLQVVAADLRRLGRELSLVSTGSATHRAGVQAAYDDVLAEAATVLEVPHRLTATGPGEEREVERLRLVVALADAGLVVDGPRG